jgi:hypothetical protein
MDGRDAPHVSHEMLSVELHLLTDSHSMPRPPKKGSLRRRVLFSALFMFSNFY